MVIFNSCRSFVSMPTLPRRGCLLIEEVTRRPDAKIRKWLCKNTSVKNKYTVKDRKSKSWHSADSCRRFRFFLRCPHALEFKLRNHIALPAAFCEFFDSWGCAEVEVLGDAETDCGMTWMTCAQFSAGEAPPAMDLTWALAAPWLRNRMTRNSTKHGQSIWVYFGSLWQFVTIVHTFFLVLGMLGRGDALEVLDLIYILRGRTCLFYQSGSNVQWCGCHNDCWSNQWTCTLHWLTIAVAAKCRHQSKTATCSQKRFVFVRFCSFSYNAADFSCSFGSNCPKLWANGGMVKQLERSSTPVPQEVRLWSCTFDNHKVDSGQKMREKKHGGTSRRNRGESESGHFNNPIHRMFSDDIVMNRIQAPARAEGTGQEQTDDEWIDLGTKAALL